RIARLPAGARALVEALSVLPGRIPAAALTNAEWEHVDRLCAAGLLTVTGDEIEFRHELVRLAIEAAIPNGRRRRLHEEALERLDRCGNTDPARVAHHARQAKLGQVALAAEIDAARRAAAFGSHREA